MKLMKRLLVLVIIWQILTYMMLATIVYYTVPVVRGETAEGVYEWHTLAFAHDIKVSASEVFK